ncbi:BREX system ATP-binding protein BrxD [Arthrobacter sp. FW306-07-I]|uniref:BREX system ATP-binding protein BrxD n=1 Tax=Arthrobacter sp. FW306-07-I TaxID=2879622 RepID=UPI001F22E04F|nr:BREX system ATP-binding protein BrxD [Arthrobacter sp. FW306-07-I]UKA76472.1 BREX system ATP-binding protein BrxD [Arthrobacter sp. FW306-07-I]
MIEISPRRRREVIDALRRGTVPQQGLDVLAVGLDKFDPAISQELESVAMGGAVFKAVRGEYGSGKTFFARWLVEAAKKRGFATAEIQVSETETPLHRLETVYRRVTENLATSEFAPSALREIVDGWFFALEQDVIAAGSASREHPEAFDTAVVALMERRLEAVTRTAPAFSAVLRGYREALRDAHISQAEGLLAWLGGQPHVAASIRRTAGIRGELDHFGALGSLQGLLTILRDSEYKGLVIVLDEVETLQRVRSDVREKSLNALRQLVDEVDAGRFPGLYILITGTPAFYDGSQGMQRLQPLAQRLAVDFSTDSRFDNPRAAQIRLAGFSHESLMELGCRVRDIYASGSDTSNRIVSIVDDSYVGVLARAISGELGGRTGVAPRLFVKKLVGDVLDRVDQFPDFDPRKDYALTVEDGELTESELAASRLGDRRGRSVDDVDLEI